MFRVVTCPHIVLLELYQTRLGSTTDGSPNLTSHKLLKVGMACMKDEMGISTSLDIIPKVPPPDANVTWKLK